MRAAPVRLCVSTATAHSSSAVEAIPIQNAAGSITIVTDPVREEVMPRPGRPRGGWRPDTLDFLVLLNCALHQHAHTAPAAIA